MATRAFASIWDRNVRSLPAPKGGLHRATLAGISGKFVKRLKQRKAKPGTQELYVDVMYKNELKPGAKVNILSAFSDDNFTGLVPHIYGAWDGPMSHHDARFIITLPGQGSAVPLATETLKSAVKP